MIRPGQFVKARFWPGEMAWAKVEIVEDGIVFGTLCDKPVHPAHFEGDAVICPVPDVIEVLAKG